MEDGKVYSFIQQRLIECLLNTHIALHYEDIPPPGTKTLFSLSLHSAGPINLCCQRVVSAEKNLKAWDKKESDAVGTELSWFADGFDAHYKVTPTLCNGKGGVLVN